MKRMMLGAIVTMFLLNPFVTLAANVTFGISAETTKVGEGEGATYAPGQNHFVVNGTVIYAAFGYSPAAGDREIYVAKSADGGLTWRRAEVVAHDPRMETYGVAIASGPANPADPDQRPILHLLFGVRNNGTMAPGIYYTSARMDTYQQWSQPLLLSDAQSGQWPWGKNITTDANGGVHVMFSGLNGVMYRQSTDNGTTWGPLNVVGTKDNSDHEHALYVNNAGDVFAAWPVRQSGEGLYFARKLAGGNWSTPAIIDAAWTSTPQLAGDTSTLYLQYGESSGQSLRLLTSSDKGVTWSAPSTIATSGIQDSALAVGSTGTVNSVWGQAGVLKFSRKTNSGTWLTPVTIGDGYYPNLNLDASGKALIFYTNEGAAYFTKEK